MKNNNLTPLLVIIIFILLFIILSGQKSTNQIEVVPAKPKSVIIKTFHNRDVTDDMKNFIMLKVKEGYIVKETSIGASQYAFRGIIILEKY